MLPDSKHDLAEGMKSIYDPFASEARRNHACPCCERDFNPEEEDDFVKKVDFFLFS